jgi:hypothetical protein
MSDLSSLEVKKTRLLQASLRAIQAVDAELYAGARYEDMSRTGDGTFSHLPAVVAWEKERGERHWYYACDCEYVITYGINSLYANYNHDDVRELAPDEEAALWRNARTGRFLRKRPLMIGDCSSDELGRVDIQREIRRLHREVVIVRHTVREWLELLPRRVGVIGKAADGFSDEDLYDASSMK